MPRKAEAAFEVEPWIAEAEASQEPPLLYLLVTVEQARQLAGFSVSMEVQAQAEKALKFCGIEP